MTLANDGLLNAKAYRHTYADATARAAASGFVPADVGLLALQLDNASLWVLSDDSPVTWVAVGGSGMTNPMTTAGDIIVGDTGGTPIRKAKGSDSTVLTIDPTTHLPVWAAPSGGGGTLVALHDETLGVDTATLTYSPPGSGYRDLLIAIDGSTDEAATNSVIWVRLNGDSGGNYDSHAIDIGSSLSTDQQFAQTKGLAGYLPGTSAPATTPGSIRGEIPDYLETSYHQPLGFVARLKQGTTSGNLFRGERSNWWRNAAAVTQIDFTTATGGKKFKAGSRFTVWGVAAS